MPAKTVTKQAKSKAVKPKTAVTKAKAVKPKKAAKPEPAHPPFLDMASEAIVNTEHGRPKRTSLFTVRRYIAEEFGCGPDTHRYTRTALNKLIERGALTRLPGNVFRVTV